jgi:hypothetical protein
MPSPDQHSPYSPHTVTGTRAKAGRPRKKARRSKTRNRAQPADVASRPPPTHLTMVELAARLRRERKTVERHYQAWGLRPLRLGGRLLFPISQVLEFEERAMRGEFVGTGTAP